MSSLLLAGDSLLETLKQSGIGTDDSFIFKTDPSSITNKPYQLPLIIQAYQQNLSESKKWNIDTSITRHINPKLNMLRDSACIDCGLDKALGLISQIQYRSTDSFSIGIQTTIFNTEDKNTPNNESIFDNVKLDSFRIVCILTI
jgi:hypothetical protein